MNLISLPELDRQGFVGTWGQGRLDVTKEGSGKVILSGRLAQNKHSRRLYQVDVVEEETRTVAASSRSRNKPTDLQTWHRRFGHSDIRAVQSLWKSGLIEGLEICGQGTVEPGTVEPDHICEPCKLGKAVRKPFDDTVSHETLPLERVHVDLWGRARTQSQGGANYMMLIGDGGSGCKFPEFLANKQAATILEKFTAWHLEAERQTGRKLKIIRTDLGGEFDNKEFRSYCRNHGVKIKFLPKGSSASNGHVERANRTIIEGARTQMIDAAMPHSWWAESALAHAYVWMFIPTSRHPGKIPWQVWYNTEEKPNMIFLEPILS